MVIDYVCYYIYNPKGGLFLSFLLCLTIAMASSRSSFVRTNLCSSPNDMTRLACVILHLVMNVSMSPAAFSNRSVLCCIIFSTVLRSTAVSQFISLTILKKICANSFGLYLSMRCTQGNLLLSPWFIPKKQSSMSFSYPAPIQQKSCLCSDRNAVSVSRASLEKESLSLSLGASE